MIISCQNWYWHRYVQNWYPLNDDVIKWKHFSRYWPFVRGIHRSPRNSPHKDQLRGALMFSLICAWINGWVNNREAGDLRRPLWRHCNGIYVFQNMTEIACNMCIVTYPHFINSTFCLIGFLHRSYSDRNVIICMHNYLEVDILIHVKAFGFIICDAVTVALVMKLRNFICVIIVQILFNDALKPWS